MRKIKLPKILKSKNESGAVTLIFVTIMALIVTIILAATNSRLLLALRRSQSSVDILVANYEAESIANDIMARLVGGYLPSANLPQTTITEGDTTITYEGTEVDDTQTITVTANRDFAVGKVQAIRKIESIKKVEEVEIILGLDCTSSMDAGASCDNCFSRPTRFDAQKDAAIDFVDKVEELEDADKFRLGVSVFGIDAKWLEYSGRNVTPENNLSFDEIKDAINNGFGSTRNESPACLSVMNATSIGSSYSFAHNYFEDRKDEKIKQIEITISDGVPNSRVPQSGCNPNVFCPAFPISQPDGSTNYCEDNEYGWDCYQYETYRDGPYESDFFNETAFNLCQPLGMDFLRCSVADTETFVPELGTEGIRDPDVDAYAVTIFSNPPRETVSVLRNYATENGYFNASRANQLKNILNNILNEILKERSAITIKRLIPIAQ